MRHKWDYSQYGRRPSDMLVKGRRVCSVCGAEQTKSDRQNWGRVIGYEWSGDGRAPCPGPPAYTRDDARPGDLVEDDRGRRYVVARRVDWPNYGSDVYVHPATKAGKIDKRRGGYGYIMATRRLKLIRREPVTTEGEKRV